MGDYASFIEHVYRITGINLADYKEAQMKRRLTSFREREGFRSFHTLVQGLEDDPGLLERFLNRMTINVSEFFRNPERWRCLQEEVLPVLHQRFSALKCWSAACSTGEEPYTLAMILEQLRYRYELWATDIDRPALEKAKAGEYERQTLKHVSTNLRQTYLNELADGRFRVKNRLKTHIRFEHHDLLRDSYPSQRHLIVCRNVLIYFTDAAKERIYRSFARSLLIGGVLFVGSTEQILRPEQYGFSPVAPFIYERTN